MRTHMHAHSLSVCCHQTIPAGTVLEVVVRRLDGMECKLDRHNSSLADLTNLLLSKGPTPGQRSDTVSIPTGPLTSYAWLAPVACCSMGLWKQIITLSCLPICIAVGDRALAAGQEGDRTPLQTVRGHLWGELIP